MPCRGSCDRPDGARQGTKLFQHQTNLQRLRVRLGEGAPGAQQVATCISVLLLPYMAMCLATGPCKGVQAGLPAGSVRRACAR